MWTPPNGPLAPGAPCLLRYRCPDGRVQAELPLRVVEDGDDATVAWLAAGTRVRCWSTEEGGDPRTLPLERRFETVLTTGERVWEGPGVLHVMRPGRRYQVLLFWRADGAFSHWYVNFERPIERDGGLFATVDSHLDLVIAADGSAAWKDWDEAAAAVGTPHLLLEDLVQARAAGRALLEDLRSWPSPMHDRRDFQPPADRSPAPLPATDVAV